MEVISTDNKEKQKQVDNTEVKIEITEKESITTENLTINEDKNAEFYDNKKELPDKMKTMIGAFINNYGSNTVIVGTQWFPLIKEDTQVIIEVYAAGVNPIDYKIRDGWTDIIFPIQFPKILGFDVAGVIIKIGSKVSKFKIGDRVFGRLRDELFGSFAEYALAYEDDLAIIPSNLSFTEAAGIPLVALTVYQCLIESEVKKTDKLFISGGAGGIGTFALQFAKKYLEVNVIATTASEKKIEHCRSLGADIIIDYKKEDFTEKLKDYDVAFDTTGEAWKIMDIVKPYKGRVITIATIPSPEEVKKPLKWYASGILTVLSSGWKMKAWIKAIQYKYTLVKSNGSQLATIAQLYEKGLIKVIIDKTFPLEKTADALNYLKQGHATGKVIIVVKSS